MTELHLVVSEDVEDKDVNFVNGVLCVAYRNKPKHGAIKHFANPYIPKKELEALEVKLQAANNLIRTMKGQLSSTKEHCRSLQERVVELESKKKND